MTSKQTMAIAIFFACLCFSTLYRVVRYHETDKVPVNEKQERRSASSAMLNVLKGRKQIVDVAATLSSPRRLDVDKDLTTENNFSIVTTPTSHSKVKSTPSASPRVKICVCALTRSKTTWKTLDDSRVMKNVIASTHRTTAMQWDKFEVQILLGADTDDTFWQQHADALKQHALVQYELQVTFKFYPKHANFLPFNDLMHDGYHTGSEYLVRINDDTEFTSNGWISLGVRTLQGFQPPNVGVVGPSCAQGNTKILTHDMVHRTHLHIFKTYYPPVFHNWYLDDWISLVYGPARTKKIKNWTVFHHVEQQGQRYAAVTTDSQSLQVEVDAGGKVISRYLETSHKVTKTRKYPGQYIAYSSHGNNTRFTNYITSKTLHAITSSARADSLQLLVTKAREIHISHGFVNVQFLNAGYVEMTKSWICNVRSFKNVLNATLFLTTDHEAFDQLHRFDTNLNLVRILYSAPKNMAYGQYSYRKYMLFRANTIVRLLQENVSVWLTESDAVWLKDPTDLVQNSTGDFVTMSDGLPPEKLLQGGFLFLRPTPRTLALWTRMRAEIKAKIETVQVGMDMGGFGSDQLTLNTIIKKEKDLHIHWLDPQKFVPGLYYKNPKAYVLPVVVLNNWIIGNKAKKERAKKWGHWFLQQDGKCHATSKDVRISETAAKQHRMSLFTTRLTVPECIHSKTFTEKSTRKMICLDKIVPHACTVYSFGINYQWEFDDFMHAYGCVVRSFDPGMQYQRQRGARHFFEAVGIGAQSGLHQGESTLYSKKKTYNVETLESIMQRHGDTFVDLVRLDVESAEFDVLDTLPYDRIGQLSLEIHMWKHTLMQWTLKLQAVKLRHVQTFQNTDRVNPRTMTEIAPGVTRVYELTFINTQQQKRVHVPAHAADATSVDAVIVSNYVNCVTRAVVDGLCSHLQNIGRVHVIVPVNALLACTALPNVTCHDENTILNPETSWVYGQNRLGWTAAGSRRAWYYQQMLKLFAFQRIELSPQFVLWDADNVLVQPYSPFLHQSLRFLTAGDGMPERGQYIPTTRALIGDVKTRRDVVVHQMPVDSVMLQELLVHVCGARTHEVCARHILDSIPPAAHPALGFSEYHLFYTWVSSRHHARVLLDSEKKLTRTGKKVWTSDSCMRALAATHGTNVFMLVLEQKTDYVIRKRSASGPAAATVQAWGGASAHPSSGPKHCRWVTFQNTYEMCVHEHVDTVSDTIARTGRWPDCDILHALWQKRPLASTDDVYVEIGGNIGSCVLHMLLHTDARMIVFEPNPDNLFCMTSTLLRLPVHVQIRVTLYPVALGDKASSSKLFVSSTNAGNGIVNHKIGREHEVFNAPIEIQVRRYDALFSAKDRVGLLKMDAQGHECAIVRGMGTQLSHIQVLKTEISNLWLSGHENCSDSILFRLFHAHGRRVTNQHGVTMSAPEAADVYDVVVW